MIICDIRDRRVHRMIMEGWTGSSCNPAYLYIAPSHLHLGNACGQLVDLRDSL